MPRSLPILALAVLTIALCAACETLRPPGQRARQEAKQDELAEEFSQESLTPVEGFEDESFEDLEQAYAEQPDPLPWELDDFEDIPLNPYLEFGESIIQYDDGRIMKPYPLPSGQGEKIDQLLRRYGDFTIFQGEPGTEQPLDSVGLDVQADWITESWADPRNENLSPGIAVPLGDVLFVTASAPLLREVEHIINLFAAEVRQIEIEAKIVEVTTTDSLSLGIGPVDRDTPILGLPNPRGVIRSLDYAFPTADTSALLTLGAVQDGAAFNAALQAVADKENVSIISRPKVAVREGGRAEIVNTTRLPFLKVGGIDNEGGYSASIEYLDVGVQMYVIPRIVGTDTVILNIDIEASQETGSMVTFTSRGGVNNASQEISTPVLAIRKARTIVRLEPGQAVILGGLISERMVEAERKVPLLGDIPVLGLLFKSTERRKEQTNVLFFIRPRILQGSDLNRPFE